MDNLGDILDAVAEAIAADAPALIHGDVTIPWNVALTGMRTLAGSLDRLGVSRGDKIAFYFRNDVEYGELTDACFPAGFVHVKVNDRYLPRGDGQNWSGESGKAAIETGEHEVSSCSPPSANASSSPA